jgi:transketolase
VSARLIDAYSIKPLDVQQMKLSAEQTGHVLVVEDHVYEGGLGDAVSMAIAGLAPMRRLAVGSEPRSGRMQDLLEMHGISRRAIADAAAQLINAQG